MSEFGNGPENPGTEESPRVQPTDERSRRSFLRTAVLASAGLATAVGAGIAVGPQLIGHVTAQANDSNPSCGGAITKDDVASGQTEMNLEDSTYAESIQVGMCVTITNRTHTSETQQLHVASTQIINSGGTFVQLMFSAYHGLLGTTSQAFSAHSCVVISTCP